jgi:tRNA (mo5U34)-methyltransferase
MASQQNNQANNQATTEQPPPPTRAEREVADLLPIGATDEAARKALAGVPLWFHTFSLDAGSVYTSGVARDHRYRIPALPADLSGKSVLDVGTFDGFYAFLAESRGARRVVAVDNEQYKAWVEARWGIRLEGGEGFRAIAGLVGSEVVYRRLDAFDLDRLDETFDVIFCFGLLHRVSNPLGLLGILRRRLAKRGVVIAETYGVTDAALNEAGALRVVEPGEVYARDEFIYWGFSEVGLARLARRAGFAGFEVADAPMIDGHPRLIGSLVTEE